MARRSSLLRATCGKKETADPSQPYAKSADWRRNCNLQLSDYRERREMNSMDQKCGDGCRNSTPTSVLPFSVFTRRATRQAKSSSVWRLVTRRDWERSSWAESATKPPCGLTLVVSAFSEKGWPCTRP